MSEFLEELAPAVLAAADLHDRTAQSLDDAGVWASTYDTDHMGKIEDTYCAHWDRAQELRRMTGRQE